MSSDAEEEWVEIGPFARNGLRDRALVLTAAGIPYRFAEDGGMAPTVILVAARHAAAARRELKAFEDENRQRDRVAPPPPLPPFLAGLPATAIAAILMIVLFRFSWEAAFGHDWLAAGAAKADLIAEGAWWRAFTALGLHVDLSHLAGNLVAGALFGLLLSQVVGAGVAWLATLLAGGLANILVALVQPGDMVSIGASTAVFAALGAVSVLMLRRRTLPRYRGLSRWAPLIAGTTLMFMFGQSGSVEAHVTGFVTGCLAGIVLMRMDGGLAGKARLQTVCGLLALALFLGAWAIALEHVPEKWNPLFGNMLNLLIWRHFLSA